MADDRPGFEEAVHAAYHAGDASIRAVIEIAYPIIEAALRERYGEAYGTGYEAGRVDRTARIVRALRTEGAKGEASTWTFAIAAAFIEREMEEEDGRA